MFEILYRSIENSPKIYLTCTFPVSRSIGLSRHHSYYCVLALTVNNSLNK